MARTIKVTTLTEVMVVGNIPDEAKITYGGLRPDQPGQKGNTLRIYRKASGDNQLAVFRDVVSFVDCDLTVEPAGKPKEEWM